MIVHLILLVGLLAYRVEYIVAVETVGSTLNQNGAGILSDLLAQINSNCLDNDQSCAQTESLYQICHGNKSESALLTASEDCKVTCNVCPVYKGQVTIFAPLNSSFGDNLLEGIHNFSVVGTNLLREFIVKGQASLKDAKNNLDFTNLNGGNIRINVYKDRGSNIILANGVPVTQHDIIASGNVIHITEGILPESKGNIIETMETMHEAHDFLRLLQKTGLDTMLRSPRGHFTVFLPSNYAFATNGVPLIRARNTTHTEEVVKFHIVRHTYYSHGLPLHPRTVNTMLSIGVGEQLYLNRTLTGMTVNGIAKVYKVDVPATNGVIQVIDHVLYPKVLPPSIVG